MSRTGRTILIVDDDAPIRVLLRSILARAGYLTREAKNGQEALESIAGQKFDAILLDLMMPGISGFDILENMRNTKPEWLRSVIVVTAASDKDVRRVNPDEVFKILRKPFEIDELLRTIEQCISAAE